MQEVKLFLDKQKTRRTKDEILQFLEMRMKLLIPESKIKEQLRQVEKEGRWAF
jgi:hypothetical protein